MFKVNKKDARTTPGVFRKTNISFLCVRISGVGNVSFSENFAYVLKK